MEIINRTKFIAAPMPGRLNFPGHSLTLIIKGTFDLSPEGTVQVAEEQLFPTGDELYPGDEDLLGSIRYESDFSFYKPKADLLLVGKCHTPGGKYVPACRTTFRVDRFEKSLGVFGNRKWQRSTLGLGVMADPEPFSEMELRYDKSFGGMGFKENPTGIGYAKEESTDGKKVKKIPNIEDGKNLINSPGQKPDPTGFGPLNRQWKRRSTKLGTYKGDYLQKRWPWFPEDFDYSYFNAAPHDMQVEGYLRGDEKLYFENMHKQHSQYHSQLPGLRLRCFVTRQTQPDSEESRFDEVPVNLDTLWVDMESEQLVLVWRGWTEVSSEEFEEIRHLFLLSEPIDEEPQTKPQCHSLFISALQELEGESAEPAEEPEPPAVEKPAEKKIPSGKVKKKASEELGKEELNQHIQSQLAALSAQLGFNISALPENVQKEMSDLQQKMLDKITENDFSKISGMQLEEKEEKLREELDKIGVDYDNLPELSEKAKLEQKKLIEEMGIKDTDMLDDETISQSMQLIAAVLPKVGLDPENLDQLIESAKPHFEKIKEQIGLEPSDELQEQSREGLKAKSKKPEIETKTKVSAEGSEGESIKKETQAQIELNKKLEQGESLEGMDLSGHDFSGQKLSGIDLSGTVLAGAILSGVDMEGAILADSDLKKADLSEANLSGANLAKADLNGANLEKCNLEGADLTECILDSCNLKNSQLSDANFEKARITTANLENVIATGALFTQADLTGSSCKQGNFSSSEFNNGTLHNVNFAEADLSEANLEGVQGKNINCEQANLNKLRAAEKSDFSGGKFSKSCGEDSIWQEAKLTGADFTYCLMPGADFSKCNLEKANLSGCDLKSVRFARANLKSAKMVMSNLFESRMEKADLTGANLSQSNMYATEFLDATIDDTKFNGTNLKMTKLAKGISDRDTK